MFVTGNEGKVERLRLALSLYCPSTADACDVEVRGVDLEIQEIQADTVLEVATAKAEAAFERLGVPLVVHDCGLVVRALNDWPGPYTKDANYKLGTEGLMALLADVEDRAAGWDDVIAYVDDAGAVTTFAPDPSHRYAGEIAPEPPRRYRRFPRAGARARENLRPDRVWTRGVPRGRLGGGVPAVPEGSAVRVERLREVVGGDEAGGGRVK